MNDQERTYDVLLLGRRLKLRSRENEAHIQRVVSFTERTISEIMLASRHITYETAVSAAALRFAEEMLALQDDVARLRRELDEHTAKKG